MNWLFYLLEANSYVIVFFAFYKAFLQKETFYSLNRYFLILSSSLSFLLPLVRFSNLNPEQNGQANMYYAGSTVEENIFTLENGIAIFYVLIILIGLTRLLFKLAQIYRMIGSGTVEKIGKIYMVPSYQSLPFSFFNYLFISPNSEKQDTILRHEKVHIQQWHSADILYFELLAIVNWFNPFVHLMQREIKAIHEFLADEQASKEESGLDEYALFLIRNSCAADQKYPTSQMFNQSLLKKRIVMLSKKKSPPASRLKYGLMIMIIPVMVCASSMALTKNYGIDLARLTTAAQDTPKVKKEKDAKPLQGSAKVKKDIPEPKVEQVRFPSKPASKKAFPEPKVEQVKFPSPKPVSKKAFPEPKVEQVKFPSPKPVSKKAFPEPKVEQVRFPSPKPVKKDIPKPKVEQVKFPSPGKEASKPTRPSVAPKDKQVPPPPPPVEPSKDKQIPPPPPPVEPSKD